MESELSKLSPEDQAQVKQEAEKCRRNYVICVIKG